MGKFLKTHFSKIYYLLVLIILICIPLFFLGCAKKPQTIETGLKDIYLEGEPINLNLSYFRQFSYEFYKIENNTYAPINTLPEFGCRITDCINEQPIYKCSDPGPETCASTLTLDGKQWSKKQEQCGYLSYTANKRETLQAGKYSIRINYYGTELCEGTPKTFEKNFNIIGCLSDADCMPNDCCHASACTSKTNALSCKDALCTLECVPGTLDCGQGSCICREGKCSASIFK